MAHSSAGEGIGAIKYSSGGRELSCLSRSVRASATSESGASGATRSVLGARRLRTGRASGPRALSTKRPARGACVAPPRADERTEHYQYL